MTQGDVWRRIVEQLINGPRLTKTAASPWTGIVKRKRKAKE
jgi:hypothetical protein